MWLLVKRNRSVPICPRIDWRFAQKRNFKKYENKNFFLLLCCVFIRTKTRVDLKILSDTESDVENAGEVVSKAESTGNSIPDAFVFCANIRTLQVEGFLKRAFLYRKQNE